MTDADFVRGWGQRDKAQTPRSRLLRSTNEIYQISLNKSRKKIRSLIASIVIAGISSGVLIAWLIAHTIVIANISPDGIYITRVMVLLTIMIILALASLKASSSRLIKEVDPDLQERARNEAAFAEDQVNRHNNNLQHEKKVISLT